MFSHFSQVKRISQSGFGLVELLVSITIMVIIMGIVLIQNTSFNGAVLLRSQAFEIALQIREVQLTAVSVADSIGGGGFRSVYGVHFYTSSPLNQSFRIFRDDNRDLFHNTNEEYGLQGIIDNRFIISAIRVDGANYTNAGGLSIMFERPNFDARFFSSPGNQLTADIVEIDIALKDNPTTLRTIEVTSAGQIAIQSTI